MSAIILHNDIPATLPSRTLQAVYASKRRFDAALVRFDAWFLVFVAVILAFGAALLAGMAIWCVVNQGKTFTGEWSFRDYGLKVFFRCV